MVLSMINSVVLIKIMSAWKCFRAEKARDLTGQMAALYVLSNIVGVSTTVTTLHTRPNLFHKFVNSRGH